MRALPRFNPEHPQEANAYVHERAERPESPGLPPGATLLEDGDPSGGIFNSLFDVYRGQGYEQGYQRALSDVLGSLLLLTEDYLRRQQPGEPDLRQLLYRFEEHLEHHIETMSPSTVSREYVSDGLGI